MRRDWYDKYCYEINYGRYFLLIMCNFLLERNNNESFRVYEDSNKTYISFPKKTYIFNRREISCNICRLFECYDSEEDFINGIEENDNTINCLYFEVENNLEVSLLVPTTRIMYRFKKDDEYKNIFMSLMDRELYKKVEPIILYLRKR